jgi:hypothetical protein
MAAGYVYQCNECRFSMEAWDDDKVHVTDYHGKRHYYHHPERDTKRKLQSESARGKTCNTLSLSILRCNRIFGHYGMFRVFS